MNDEHVFWSRRLDEYLDGEMDSAGKAEMDGHLAGCATCREELEWLVGLQESARQLPPEVAPTRDLWSGIEERIDPSSRRAAPSPLATAAPALTRPNYGRWMAAAAVVLIMVSSGTTALLLRQERVEPEAAVAPRPAGLAAFASSQVEYESAVDALRQDLEASRSRLQPETIAAVEQNLAIIDEAIVEARAALAADPLNADLPLLLAGVYRQKVELLRTAVTLAARPQS